jgi:putative ABC transport system ATP-binding protein
MIKQDNFILIWMENLIIQNKIIGKGGSVVDNLNLRIDNSEYICISGLYGTDKVSFINTISCLNRPDSGKYIYNYIDTTTIGKATLDSLRSGIGFIFKSLNIIENLTVYQNIEIPLNTGDALEKSHIFKVAERLGLSSLLHTQAKDLSDLERHKTAIARALAVNPIFIIADEPASNLKQQDEKIILDILREINMEGIAIICFSERKQVIDRVERHIVFENGSIVADNKDFICYKEEETV